MGFRYDATGVDANGGYPIIETEGWYPFKIVDATPGKSKNGDFQVTVDAVCTDRRWKDYKVRHWVTFLPKTTPDGLPNKGAGMAIHWLKSIGEPYENVLDVEPRDWENATFMGKVIISEYQGKRNNKFAEIGPMKDDLQATGTDDKAPWD
jgi:hypothetical protein